MSTATMSAVRPNVHLDPEAVREIFRKAESQNDYFSALYSAVHPEWPRVKRLETFPVCSPDTWSAICKLAMTVDGRINTRLPFERQIMPGGGWMNSGFSTRDDLNLALWEVVPGTATMNGEAANSPQS